MIEGNTLRSILTNFPWLLLVNEYTIKKRRQFWIKPISVYDDTRNINAFNDFWEDISRRCS